MNNESSGTGMVVGILVIVVIAIVVWIAYTQGFFMGKEEGEDKGGLEINLGGSTDSSN
ncbi:MAG: hypothetical protein AAB381_01050 [Patescibacteria group bacterium]